MAEAKRSVSNESSANNSYSSEQGIESVCKVVAVAETSLETNWSSMLSLKTDLISSRHWCRCVIDK